MNLEGTWKTEGGILHNITRQDDDDNQDGLKGKLVAFFDIERDPLVQKIKGKSQEKKEDWVLA